MPPKAPKIKPTQNPKNPQTGQPQAGPGSSNGKPAPKRAPTSAPKTSNAIEHRPVTRARNQEQHPGDHHNKYTIVRRTPAEIEADRQAAAAAQLTAKSKKIAVHQAQIQKAVDVEAKIRQAQIQTRANAARPDLVQSLGRHSRAQSPRHSERAASPVSDDLDPMIVDKTSLSDYDAAILTTTRSLDAIRAFTVAL
ncbi:hypothetical protein HGRIS_004399 [Hohenbuehelia grisea]|uniref:Uncharacterized protein n=1 Tax=Hohenbuehelia grisea TaxID=104357 RepID=A0ABR3JBQ3_9AGAR